MEPSVKAFVAKVNLERQIGVKPNKMTKYNKQWEKLLTSNFV